MPFYPLPNRPSQPYTGNLPTMKQVGPSDLRYSSGTSQFYQNKIDAAHGRRLAGLGAEVQDEGVDQGWAANELAVYAEMDDVDGNGVFDPPGTRPNIYPDAGVLAARFGIPGYLARERMYADSEVVDVTTGRPVVYVNGGAVSMDSVAQIAFIERGMYDPPNPVIGAARAGRMQPRSIVNVRVNPEPITKTAPPAVGAMPGGSTLMTLAVIGLVGLAAGAAYSALK